MQQTYARVSRRRAEARQRIMEVAIYNFAERGINNVSLEEIATQVDLSRATLYSHFESKEALIYEILAPVLTRAATETSKLLTMKNTNTLELLLKFFYLLWHEYRNNLRLIYQLKKEELGRLAEIHEEFLKNIIQIFENESTCDFLRFKDANLAALVTYRIAIPLLESFDGMPEQEEFFLSTIKGAIMKEESH